MHDLEVIAGPAPFTLDQLRERIRACLEGTRVSRAILFGSFARGTADAFSDVDLVLIEPNPRPFVERGLDHLPLMKLGLAVDLLVYTPEEYERLRLAGNPFIERVEREGITIHARSEC